MVLKWESWFGDPALNVMPPPVGAPENTTRYRDVNDIHRYVMAAVWEIGDWLTDVENSIGTLGIQNANTVAITGGAISNTTMNATNNINASALQDGIIPNARYATTGVPLAKLLAGDDPALGGLNAQALYDFIYPTGTVRLTTNDATTYPLPPQIVATWVRFNVNRYIKLIQPASYTGDVGSYMVGGEAEQESNPGGAITNKRTNLHTLTVDEMPSHRHTQDGGGSLTGQATGYASGGTLRNSSDSLTDPAGGGQGHQHDIPDIAAHIHTVPLDPQFLGVIGWVRTA